MTGIPRERVGSERARESESECEFDARRPVLIGRVFEDSVEYFAVTCFIFSYRQ